MPAIHYWFSGAAIFVAGGFLLTAVLGFWGVAEQMKRRPLIAVAAYVITLCLFAIGWWQAAQQGADAENAQKALRGVQANEKTLLTSNDRMSKAIGGLAQDVSGLTDQMRRFVAAAIATSRQPPVPATPSRPTKEKTKKGPPTSTGGEVAHLKYVVRPTPSTDPAVPYEAQVIIQTDETISNPYFAVVCDNNLTSGDFFVTGQGVTMNVRTGITGGGKAFAFRFGFPAFTPDGPIVVTLHSKNPINVLAVRDLRGH